MRDIGGILRAHRKPCSRGVTEVRANPMAVSRRSI